MKPFTLEEYAVPEPNSGCWLWALRTVDDDGYGRVFRGPRRFLAHRMSYETYRGPIPAGMLVCHTCDTPSCINPSHLFLGTHVDNHRDRDRKQRQARGQSHGRAKLTEDMVREIRRARASGEPQRKLAQRLGVSRPTICDIESGRHWRHVA